MPKLIAQTHCVMINIENRKIGDIAVLDLKGRLVADTENIFWKEASSELVENGTRKLILNMAELAICDSFGIGEILKIHNSIENIGGRMMLCELNPLISKVFAITKVDTVLHILKDEKGALEAFAIPALEV